MTQDEISPQDVIEMARQAGMAYEEKLEVYVANIDDLQDFAKLVAAKAFPDGVDAEWIARRTKYAVEQEREACEAVCNKLSANKPDEPTSFDFRYGAGCCAQAIRARKEGATC